MRGNLYLTEEDIRLEEFADSLVVRSSVTDIVLSSEAATKLAVELNINGFGKQYLKQHLIEAQMLVNEKNWIQAPKSEALRVATEQIEDLLSHIK
jgi:hypothetical protein